MHNITSHRISLDDIETPAQCIAELILHSVALEKPVLWLVSGGSCIGVAVAVSEILSKNISDTAEIHVALVDERYGAQGHENSNWSQLMSAGFVTGSMHMNPILQTSSSVQETTEDYNIRIQKLLDRELTIIGLFGIGADGHTAGLLPNNSVSNSEKLYAHYDGLDFERITATPKMIGLAHHTVIYATGDTKKVAISELIESGAKSNLPAAVLWQNQNAALFSDQIK